MGNRPTEIIEDEAQWAEGSIIIYQLRFDNGKIYTGITRNLDGRITKHSNSFGTNRRIDAELEIWKSIQSLYRMENR